VFSHLAVPSHVWNTSPGVFYAAPDQLYAVGEEEESSSSSMDSFTAILFTIADPPVTNFKVPVVFIAVAKSHNFYAAPGKGLNPALLPPCCLF
jgi:hypothetical protein